MANTNKSTATESRESDRKAETVYCVDCGAETELECICDELNFADHYCDCGCHNEI